jgi:REP element-mobilizing transposase RayT
MARSLRIQYDGAFYHVTARGNEKRRIYFSNADYEKFKYYINRAQEKYQFLLHCFVLMVNHYHLVIETPFANLNSIMHYINSSYTNYVNRKMKRSGHLLQGRYKAILIDHDSYLLELSRYLHLNPVRAGIVQRPEDYPYSSYVSFIGKRSDENICRDFILGMVSQHEKKAMQAYRNFVEHAMGTHLDNPLQKIHGGVIAGERSFVTNALGKLAKLDLSDDDIANRRALRSRYTPDEIMEKLSLIWNVDRNIIVNDTIRGYRSIAIYLMKKYTGLTNKEIGQVFGNLSYSGVSKVYRRFEEKIGKDRSLKKKVADLMSNVKG